MTHETVVVPRGDVQYVATKYGMVNLLGKSLQGRAMAMISIAHPDFREEFFQAAKEDGLIGSDKSMGESRRGIYPVRFEERLEVDGQDITIRPAKLLDNRRIQEHCYQFKKEDVFLHFFHGKTIFGHTEVEGKSQADYIKDFALVGVVGEFGFDKAIAGLMAYTSPQNKAIVQLFKTLPYR